MKKQVEYYWALLDESGKAMEGEKNWLLHEPDPFLVQNLTFEQYRKRGLYAGAVIKLQGKKRLILGTSMPLGPGSTDEPRYVVVSPKEY